MWSTKPNPNNNLNAESINFFNEELNGTKCLEHILVFLAEDESGVGGEGWGSYLHLWSNPWNHSDAGLYYSLTGYSVIWPSGSGQAIFPLNLYEIASDIRSLELSCTGMRPNFDVSGTNPSLHIAYSSTLKAAAWLILSFYHYGIRQSRL